MKIRHKRDIETFMSRFFMRKVCENRLKSCENMRKICEKGVKNG